LRGTRIKSTSSVQETDGRSQFHLLNKTGLKGSKSTEVSCLATCLPTPESTGAALTAGQCRNRAASFMSQDQVIRERRAHRAKISLDIGDGFPQEIEDTSPDSFGGRPSFLRRIPASHMCLVIAAFRRQLDPFGSAHAATGFAGNKKPRRHRRGG